MGKFQIHAIKSWSFKHLERLSSKKEFIIRDIVIFFFTEAGFCVTDTKSFVKKYTLCRVPPDSRPTPTLSHSIFRFHDNTRSTWRISHEKVAPFTINIWLTFQSFFSQEAGRPLAWASIEKETPLLTKIVKVDKWKRRANQSYDERQYLCWLEMCRRKSVELFFISNLSNFLAHKTWCVYVYVQVYICIEYNSKNVCYAQSLQHFMLHWFCRKFVCAAIKLGSFNFSSVNCSRSWHNSVSFVWAIALCIHMYVCMCEHVYPLLCR